jgi:hypothetical protein
VVGARFNFATTRPLDDAASNGALLDAFEPDFTPTNAATDEHARAAYQRDELVAAVVAARKKPGGAFAACGIVRKNAPKYSGYFSSRTKMWPSYLTLKFDEMTQPQVASVLALSARLAAALELDYGTAHLTFRNGTPMYNASGDVPPKDLQKYGPLPLGARTWLGPHIVGLIGRDKLEASGAKISSTPWGAVRVDLLDDLASQPMETLQAKQAEVMAKLAETGVFAIFKLGELTKKGPRWTPLPVD